VYKIPFAIELITRRIKVCQYKLVSNREAIYEHSNKCDLPGQAGMLRDIAGVVAKMGGNIVYTQQFVVERGVNRARHRFTWK